MNNDTQVNVVWKDVPGHEINYEVSNMGLIRRKTDYYRRKSGHISPGTLCGRYMNFAFYCDDGTKDRQYVHRIVMLAFVGARPKNAQVNHINGIKTDNRLENLEYVTASENIIHARDVLGTYPIGIKRAFAKLTENDVRKIRELHNSGLKHTELAEIYNVSANTIGCCVARKTWKHIL